LECWNDWVLGPGKKVPGSERLVTRQVKRLVLSGRDSFQHSNKEAFSGTDKPINFLFGIFL